MYVFQVEDVDKKFAELDMLKASDWVMTKQSPVKPKRVIVSANNSFCLSVQVSKWQVYEAPKPE